jgi:NAD+ kinase
MSKKIRKVLIVYKKSSYEAHAIDAKDENYLRLLRERNVVIRRSKTTHDIHIDTFQTVKNKLHQLQIPYDVHLRYDLRPIRGYDLVLTIGGDGTFLETTHYLEKGLILGINSVPEESVGFFCRATAGNFLEKIYQYVSGTHDVKILHRLEMKIDGKKRSPLALNDILFANKNPAGTTRYVLKVRGMREEQKSSGLWVSPAAGSTAATKSAGGKRLPLDSKKIQYVIREPYAPPEKSYRLLRGVLDPRERVEILCMMDDAALFLDGPHLIYPVKRGSRIVIGNANRPVQAIW